MSLTLTQVEFVGAPCWELGLRQRIVHLKSRLLCIFLL